MPSLMTFIGLNGSAFKAGLDKAVSQAQKGGSSIEAGLLGKLKQSKIISAIASPIGAAATLAVGFIGKIISKIGELQDRARGIKMAAGITHLDIKQVQPVFAAAEATGTPIEAVGKAVLKIAEAQEAVKKGGGASAEALSAFTSLGVSLADIKSKSYQQLFLEIADSMHVANLSGEQLTAGAQLMGKAFESLGPMFRRGFNNPMDMMKEQSEGQIKRLNRLARVNSVFKSAVGVLWQGMAEGVMDSGLVSKVLGGGGGSLDKAMDPEEMEKIAMRNQERVNQQNEEKAKKANAGRLKAAEDQKNFDKDLKQAAGIEDETDKKKEKADLELMSKPERIRMLQKETAELEKQRQILIARLKTEKDGHSLVPLAKLTADRTDKQIELNKLLKDDFHATPLSLTANQQLGAFSHLNSANDPMLTVAQKSEQHLARLVEQGKQPAPQPARPMDMQSPY